MKIFLRNILKGTALDNVSTKTFGDSRTLAKTARSIWFRPFRYLSAPQKDAQHAAKALDIGGVRRGGDQRHDGFGEVSFAADVWRDGVCFRDGV